MERYVGSFKSCKSKSLGLPETVTFERKLFAKVVEVDEFLVILMVAVEIGDNSPVVKGNGLGT